MIVIYGKGEVGKGLVLLLDKLEIGYTLMDDADLDNDVLTNAKTIIASPGISPKHKLYQQFESKILSELSFLGKLKKENPSFGVFFKNIITIGITGTNGKSTTSWIMGESLDFVTQTIGKKEDESDFEVYITGNFKPSLSTTLSDLWDNKRSKTGKLKKKIFLVIEVSSFMLYNIQDWTFDYGILINITVDHLDWHKDLEEYSECKKNILTCSEYSLDGKSFFENNDLIEVNSPYFLGEYNQQNFNLALDICRQLYYKNFERFYESFELNINDFMNEIFEVMEEEIKPLPHRLQLLTKIDNIKIYDDGICTSSAAQEQALKSFDEKIVLICGGAEKGDDFIRLNTLYLEKVGFAVCLGTQTAQKFMQQFTKLGISCVQVDNMKDCISESLQNAKKSNLTKILFSPGCASFDIFKNVYDRCEQFENEIKEMEN